VAKMIKQMLNARLMEHAFGFCQFLSHMVLKASLIILAELQIRISQPLILK